jgi:nitric oxide reductase large subunit
MQLQSMPTISEGTLNSSLLITCGSTLHDVLLQFWIIGIFVHVCIFFCILNDRMLQLTKSECATVWYNRTRSPYFYSLSKLQTYFQVEIIGEVKRVYKAIYRVVRPSYHHHHYINNKVVPPFARTPR